jgi:methyltransferase
MLPALYLLLGLVIGQRLVELWRAGRNTKMLLARGGVEVGKGHYPLFFILQIAWLASMAWWIEPFTRPNMFLLVVFILLQLGRVWVIATLGMYWTTRIITVPGAPLIKDGPFRFVRHPNYLVVAGEIAVLPLIFGAWKIAIVFSVLSAALTLYRIRVEERALAGRV